MILYEDSVVRLDYSPANDVVELVWPDMQQVYLPEIKRALAKTVEVIRIYDVKNLLLDASQATIAASTEESQAVSLALAKELMGTRLQRLARVESLDSAREQAIKSQLEELSKALQLTYDIQSFSDKASALAWLESAPSSATLAWQA
ncbi:hypothetical protein [Pontibacter roseus]|uniref:hypothetical protein n=1 Tax=Pontibacter roseus TaxID=336989 RepID=UPI0003689025|nr:hypothetical protein [Pontibacter roseus]